MDISTMTNGESGHTPIAQLDADLPDQPSRSVWGEVTITWPYSIATRTSAFRLVEPDFRLRNNKGQIRIEFVGPAGRAVSEAAIASGDQVELSLDGVEWLKATPPVRPNTSEHELRFKNRLRAKVQRAEGGDEIVLDINEEDKEEEAPVQPPLEVTPMDNPASPVMEPPSYASFTTPIPTAKRSATQAFLEEEFASPAFLKRARVSYGSLWEGDFESLDDEKPKKNKKTRFSMHANWRYTSRSPSPEPERRHDLEEDGMVEDEHEDDGEDEIPVTFMKLPKAKTMVGDGVQVSQPADSPAAASSPPAQHDQSGPTADMAVPRAPSPPGPGVWGLGGSSQPAESATTSLASQPEGTTDGAGSFREQQPFNTPHEPLTNTAGQPPLSMAHEDAASTLFGFSTAREPQPASSAPSGQTHNVFASTELFGTGNVYPEPDDHNLREHSSYPDPDDRAPAEDFDFGMQHDVAPFAPSQLEQAPWSTLTSMPPQMPPPTNTVENPVVLDSSSPPREPSADLPGDNVNYRQPEADVQPGEDEDNAWLPRRFTSARGATTQGTDVGSTEVSAPTSQLVEDSAESSDGGSVAGEDYDLRNYDTAQDDDVVETDGEEGPPFDQNDPDEQAVDFEEDRDDDSAAEHDEQPERDMVGSRSFLGAEVHKGEFEQDAGDVEGDYESGNDYEDEEDDDAMGYGYDESDELDEDDEEEEEEEEKPRAPSAPVFVSLLSDSEDDEPPPPKTAPTRIEQAQPSLAVVEPQLDRSSNIRIEAEGGEQQEAPTEKGDILAPVISHQTAECGDDERNNMPAQVPEEIVVKASREHAEEADDETSDPDTPMDSDVEYDYTDDRVDERPDATMETETQKDAGQEEETPIPPRDEDMGTEPSADAQVHLQQQQHDAPSSPVVFEEDRMSVDEGQPSDNQPAGEQQQPSDKEVQDEDQPTPTISSTAIDHAPISVGQEAPSPVQADQPELIDDSMSLVDSDQLRQNAVQLVEQSLATQLGVEGQLGNASTVIEVMESSVVIPSQPLDEEQNAPGLETSATKQCDMGDVADGAEFAEEKNEAEAEAQQHMTPDAQAEVVVETPQPQKLATSTAKAQHPTQADTEPLDGDAQGAKIAGDQRNQQLPTPRETQLSEENVVHNDDRGLEEPGHDEEDEEEEYSMLAEQQIKSEYESTQNLESTKGNAGDGTTDEAPAPPTEEKAFASVEAEAADEAMREVIGDDPTEEEVFEYVEQRAKSEALEEVTADERTTQAASHDGSADQSFNDLSDSQAHRMTRSKIKVGTSSRRESGLFHSLRNRDHRRSTPLVAGEDGDRPALTATALSHLGNAQNEATSPPTIHVTRSMGQDANSISEAEPLPALHVTGPEVEDGDPSLRLAMASETPTPEARRHAALERGAEASPKTRRSRRSRTPEPKFETRQAASSSSPTAARPTSHNLRSHSPAMAEGGKEKETMPSIKQKLGKQLRETLPDYLNLSSLRSHLNRVADYLAVVTATPAPSERVKNGPKDFMLELILTDPSSASSTTGSAVVVANVFRPHKKALPTVHAGDIILLRRFQVQAMAGRGYGLRSVDASAWAVFEKSDHDGLPQIKGPPVEIDDPEFKYVEGLRRWWTMVEKDERMLGKVEKAAADKAKKSKGRS